MNNNFIVLKSYRKAIASSKRFYIIIIIISFNIIFNNYIKYKIKTHYDLLLLISDSFIMEVYTNKNQNKK